MAGGRLQPGASAMAAGGLSARGAAVKHLPSPRLPFPVIKDNGKC